MREDGVEQVKEEAPKFVRPPFTLWQDIKEAVAFLLFNRRCYLILVPLIIVFESLLLKVITHKVPYTEIDYQAYMEQVEMITFDKELDYSKIRGGTGPLVYPAGHVLIYRMMYQLTNGMAYLSEGQIVFRLLYMITMILQVLVYVLLDLPPWCALFACCSKRLHSIYVLRLFNDCFTTFFVVLTVLLVVIAAKHAKTRKARNILAIISSLTYSMAVSIKMNALLYLPAMIVSMYTINDTSLLATAGNGLVMLGWQVLVALPFLKSHPMEYIKCAFDFKRNFMFKWSINWQFLDEEAFNNPWFHKSLLVSQVVAILTVLLCKYPSLPSHLLRSMRHPLSSYATEKTHIPFILLTTNFVGIIFSRSLHYQFLSWYHWTIPALLHFSHIPWQLAPVWYIAHEWCWNSYPPNSTASALLLALNSAMLLSVVCCNLKSSPASPDLNKKHQ